MKWHQEAMIQQTLEDHYKSVISAAHGYLKPRGYVKNGARFRRSIESNYVIIQFQKSAWSSPESIQFTVNFAIVSSRLATEKGDDPSKIFSEHYGHARARIGQCQPAPNDTWWTLESAISAAVVIPEVLPLLKAGTEFYEASASDRALAAAWESSNGSGLASDGRLWMRIDVKSLIAD